MIRKLLATLGVLALLGAAGFTAFGLMVQPHESGAGHRQAERLAAPDHRRIEAPGGVLVLRRVKVS